MSKFLFIIFAKMIMIFEVNYFKTLMSMNGRYTRFNLFKMRVYKCYNPKLLQLLNYTYLNRINFNVF